MNPPETLPGNRGPENRVFVFGFQTQFPPRIPQDFFSHLGIHDSFTIGRGGDDLGDGAGFDELGELGFDLGENQVNRAFDPVFRGLFGFQPRRIRIPAGSGFTPQSRRVEEPLDFVWLALFTGALEEGVYLGNRISRGLLFC